MSALQISSISSNDKPLVSGIAFRIKGTGIQHKANIKNVPAGVNTSSIHGTICPIIAVPTQSISVATDIIIESKLRYQMVWSPNAFHPEKL